MSQRHIYLVDAAAMEIGTTVLAVRGVPDGQALAFKDNLFRPSGGGEPADRGMVRFDFELVEPIVRLEKFEGQTWAIVADLPNTVQTGASVVTLLDSAHRDRKRKLHTLTHTLLAVANRDLADINVQVADIDAGAMMASIRFATSSKIESSTFVELAEKVQGVVHKARNVFIDKAKSLDEARTKYAGIFRLSDRYQLTGRVRLVVIDGLDANPCSGTHFETTNIGPYKLNCCEQGAGQIAVQFNLNEAPSALI